MSCGPHRGFGRDAADILKVNFKKKHRYTKILVYSEFTVLNIRQLFLKSLSSYTVQ